MGGLGYGKSELFDIKNVSMSINWLQESDVLLEDGSSAVKIESSFSQGSSQSSLGKGSGLFQNSPNESHHTHYLYYDYTTTKPPYQSNNDCPVHNIPFWIQNILIAMIKAKESIDILAKLIIIGDSGVGKTNIILNFVGEKFKENYVATIGVDFKAKTLQLDGKKVKLQIWDTAGQQRYRTITQTYYKGASGIILAYSMIERHTFESLNSWMIQISEKAPPGIPKIIIANKKDMADKRSVTTEEGMALAEKFSTTNCKIAYRQVSAKSSEGIQQAFYEICHKVKQQFQRDNVIKPVIKIATGLQKSGKEESSCKC